MANKNHDEIMRDRIRTQHDLIELKKMQQGQIPIPHNSIDANVAPESFKKKNENFWFYHKFQVWAIILVAAILAITINQCVSREK